MKVIYDALAYFVDHHSSWNTMTAGGLGVLFKPV
jgi:hypothetical protein